MQKNISTTNCAYKKYYPVFHKKKSREKRSISLKKCIFGGHFFNLVSVINLNSISYLYIRKAILLNQTM